MDLSVLLPFFALGNGKWEMGGIQLCKSIMGPNYVTCCFCAGKPGRDAVCVRVCVCVDINNFNFFLLLCVCR